MGKSSNKSKQQSRTSVELETELPVDGFNYIQEKGSPFASLSENIWKNTFGIQALFIVNVTGKTLYSKFSKHFDTAHSGQVDSIISSSCAMFELTCKDNSLKISIGVFEQFTTMTSQVGEQFLIMIVPNNTSVGNSIQFTESIGST